MTIPAPLIRGLSRFVARLAKRAHGITVKDTAGSVAFAGFGFIFILGKNAVIGMSAPMAFTVTTMTVIVKGRFGYQYRRVRVPVLRRFRHGRRRDAVEALVYACFQVFSFSIVMAFVTLAGYDVPGGLPRAITISFGTSLLFGKPVGWLVNKLGRPLRWIFDKVALGYEQFQAFAKRYA